MSSREPVWIAGGGEDESPTYVIMVSRNSDLVGWVTGKLSVVLDLLSDAAYADAIGEDADTIDAYVLTEYGPMMCSITNRTHTKIGFVEHVVSWMPPAPRGQRRKTVSESGYTPMLEV